MTKRLGLTRTVVLAVHAMIVLTMIAIFIGAGSLTGRNPLLAWLILLVPVFVIVWSLLDVGRKERILGYWGLAILMTPIAGLGIFGGWGLVYLVGIIFLIWAAWNENEGR